MILLQHGTLIQTDGFEMFFGNKDFSPLVEASQDSSLCLLHQVHGDACIEAITLQKPQADAHWTKDSKKQLLIKTADCLPILATSARDHKIWAIHAGWRGVEQKITTASLRTNAGDSSLRVYIGPHIQQNSFEVDFDVGERILKAHGLESNKAIDLGICLKKETKYFINLSELVLRELEALQTSRSQVHIDPIDTKTSLEHYSYRRGDTGVRNYSLVRFFEKN